MKNEKELKWIWDLYNSPHCRDIMNFKISSIPGCKKDFERICDIGENNREFNQWFKKLVSIGVFIFVDRISHRSRNNVFSKGYTIDLKKLLKYAKENPYYSNARKFFSMEVRFI